MVKGGITLEDFNDFIEKEREKEENRRLAFLDKCAAKVKNNSNLIYRLLALGLCQRFKLKLEWNNEPPEVVYAVLNYFVDEVDMDWDKWLTSEDAPMIKPISEVKRIFPELAKIYNNATEIIELANKLYDLELYIDGDCCNSPEYFYAYKFNFNTFTPINVEEIKQLKDEKEVLIKHGYDTTSIDEKLAQFGLTEEQLKEL